jgi:hypothetical protein
MKVLNINVDQNIPNLKIGLVSFHPVLVNISGVFASNVTKVEYAGVIANGSPTCAGALNTSTVTGVSSSIVNFLYTPNSIISTIHGAPQIQCAYSCDTSTWQGGCNTYDQVEHYFETVLNGNVLRYDTQYGCWDSTRVYLVSDTGTCVPLGNTQTTTVSSFQVSDTLICINEMIQLTNLSPVVGTNNWVLTGANVTTASTSNVANVMYSNSGNYIISLTHNGCTVLQTITVQNCAALKDYKETLLEIYPNPSKHSFKINFNFDGKETIIIQNLLGENVPYSLQNDSNTGTFELSNLAEGFYMITILKEQEKYSGKIFIR